MRYETFDLKRIELSGGNVPSYSWPGAYPLYYITEDMRALCPTCVNANRALIDVASRDRDAQWHIVDCTINWESPYLYCDHCNETIESAYGDATSDD